MITLLSLCITPVLVSWFTVNFLVSLSTVLVLNGSAIGVADPTVTITLPMFIVAPELIVCIPVASIIDVTGTVTLPIKLTSPSGSTLHKLSILAVPTSVVTPFATNVELTVTLQLLLCRKPPSATTLDCPVISP